MSGKLEDSKSIFLNDMDDAMKKDLLAIFSLYENTLDSILNVLADNNIDECLKHELRYILMDLHNNMLDITFDSINERINAHNGELMETVGE